MNRSYFILAALFSTLLFFHENCRASEAPHPEKQVSEHKPQHTPPVTSGALHYQTPPAEAVDEEEAREELAPDDNEFRSTGEFEPDLPKKEV